MATILIVDDDYVTHRIVSVILAGQSHTLLSAYNGLEALELLQVHTVDLILTDINMPYMDGLQLIDHVRGLPRYASLPIIVISASPLPDLPLSGLLKGSTAYISQPFSSWEFTQALHNSLLANSLSG